MKNPANRGTGEPVNEIPLLNLTATLTDLHSPARRSTRSPVRQLFSFAGAPARRFAG
jgi:hypothetical protein